MKSDFIFNVYVGKLQYKYRYNKHPRYIELNYELWQWRYADSSNDGISTRISDNGRTTVMKSLRIFVDEGLLVQISEVNIYAAGRWDNAGILKTINAYIITHSGRLIIWLVLLIRQYSLSV